MADTNIKSLFASAEKKRQAVSDSYETNTTAYSDLLSSAIALYEECRNLADRISLFSPNETLEDVTTENLQYLQIDYHVAELTEKISAQGEQRKAVIQTSREAYERYLSILSNYDILSASDKKTYELYTDNSRSFSTISTTNFEARRAAKIANFKAEKALKQKVEFLSRNPAYLQNDDDAVRNLYLAQLHLNTHNTWQALESLNLELEVLAARPPTPPSGPETLSHDYRQRMGLREDEYSERLDRPLSERLAAGNSGPILDKKGKPLRPFTLLDNRTQLRNGVFRPGHNLPTMTIDEYLEEEKRRGGIIEGGGEASGMVTEVDEDDYEKGDIETMKAREWDEFVEANPKGSGNTMNRG